MYIHIHTHSELYRDIYIYIHVYIGIILGYYPSDGESHGKEHAERHRKWIIQWSEAVIPLLVFRYAARRDLFPLWCADPAKVWVTVAVRWYHVLWAKDGAVVRDLIGPQRLPEHIRLQVTGT